METSVAIPNKRQRPAGTSLMAVLLIALLPFLQSCVGARFSQTALDNVTRVEGTMPPLMEKATGKYSDHAASVDAVIADINKALNDAAATKKNSDIAEQWRIFRDELAQPFFTRWKTETKLDKDFVKLSVEQVKKSLAAIEKSERAKPKAK